MTVFFQKLLYRSLLIFSLLYTLITLYNNLIADSRASDFLIYKTLDNYPPHLELWLNVMYVHVIAACLAMISGAVNFSTLFLKRYRRWHRINGYLYITAVLIVDLSSGFMAPYATGGKITSIPFNLVNIIWLWFTIAAVRQIKKGNVFKHRRWMIRSYVFCFTNVFIHGIEFIGIRGFGMAYELSYIFGVYGAIILNITIAEIINRTLFRHPPDITRSEK